MMKYCDECYPVAMKAWKAMGMLIVLSFIAGVFITVAAIKLMGLVA